MSKGVGCVLSYTKFCNIQWEKIKVRTKSNFFFTKPDNVINTERTAAVRPQRIIIPFSARQEECNKGENCRHLLIKITSVCNQCLCQIALHLTEMQ